MLGPLRRRLNLVGAGLAAGALDFVLLSKVWSAAPPPASALIVELEAPILPAVAGDGRLSTDIGVCVDQAAPNLSFPMFSFEIIIIFKTGVLITTLNIKIVPVSKKNKH